MYTCVVNYFLLHAKFGVIVKLTIRCKSYHKAIWSLGNLELFSFCFEFLIESKLFVKSSSNYFMNLMNSIFLWLDLE